MVNMLRIFVSVFCKGTIILDAHIEPCYFSWLRVSQYEYSVI